MYPGEKESSPGGRSSDGIPSDPRPFCSARISLWRELMYPVDGSLPSDGELLVLPRYPCCIVNFCKS
jgi:hypothetical protein